VLQVIVHNGVVFQADISVCSRGSGATQPSTEVQAIEDATIASSKDLSLEALKLNSSFPGRPGYGTQGKKITLYANYFELKPPEDLLLYRYSVAHLPNTEGTSLAGKKGRWVIKLLLRQHFADSLANIITDYR
jgi:hypothetical protein